MKGCYAILMNLEKSSEIRIGSLGILNFPCGHYLYIGSAMNGIEGRVIRHIRSRKKLHWHIDYFLKKARIVAVYSLSSKKRLECNLADSFSEGFEVVPNFGSSDCKCKGHLFYGNRYKLTKCALANGMKELNL